MTSEDSDGIDLEDVLVTIGHPFGDIEVPLFEWVARGPGPRPRVRPISARSRTTGEPIPLSLIPDRYLNGPFGPVQPS